MGNVRVVLDTNVVFEGLTRKGGATGKIVDMWFAGNIDVCISTALAYEYVDVLSRKLSAKRWERMKPVLGRLLQKAKFVPIYYSWRPMSPDAGDEHVIDCAMNSGALIVTRNIRDFWNAYEMLGVPIMRPEEFVSWWESREESWDD